MPPDATILQSKADFRDKIGPDGAIPEHKTRICARGDQQEEGIHFKEVYAPTAAANTTRMVLAEAAYRAMHVRQMDVKAAFLDAPVDKDIYLHPPKCVPVLEGKVWRLLKAVYGLHQAVNVWHAPLTAELAMYGFTMECLADCCLFLKFQGDKRTWVLVYVDDMLIGGELRDVMHVKKQLAQTFTNKDLGVAHHFLGFLIHRDELNIRLSQEQCTKQLLQYVWYQDAHPQRTPFNEGTSKECAVRCQCASAEKCKRNFNVSAGECTYAPYNLPGIELPVFVGKTMFLTRSRPGIAYSLGAPSRFVSNAKTLHEPLVKHLLSIVISD